MEPDAGIMIHSYLTSSVYTNYLRTTLIVQYEKPRDPCPPFSIFAIGEEIKSIPIYQNEKVEHAR